MVLFPLTLLAFILRLVSANQSFWLDEGASLVLARLPLANLFAALAADFHPPLFYLLLHYWLPALRSLGEVGIRLPNIIFGAASVAVLYLLLKTVLSEEKNKLALAAAFLLAINPLHIYYSAELRMYSLSTLLALLSWLYLAKAVREKSKKHRYWHFFVLISLANFYTFYGAFFNLAAQWIYVLWQNRKHFKTFALCNLFLALLFLPWLPTLVKQLTGSGYLATALPGWAALSGNLSVKSLALIMAKFTFGRISLANKSAYALFVAGVSLYFFFCSLLAFTKKESRLFLAWFFAPLLVAILVSFWAPVLGYWRYIFLIPPFVTIIVLGLNVLSGSSFYFNFLIVSLIFAFGNVVFWTSPQFGREDWRGAGKLISVDQSLSIVNFTDTFAPLKFYAPAVYYYPTQTTLGKIRPDLDQTLPLVLKDKKTVFVFDYLSDLTDRQRQILRWLKQAGLKQKKIHDINGVGFVYEFTAP